MSIQLPLTEAAVGCAVCIRKEYALRAGLGAGHIRKVMPKTVEVETVGGNKVRVPHRDVIAMYPADKISITVGMVAALRGEKQALDAARIAAANEFTEACDDIIKRLGGDRT